MKKINFGKFDNWRTLRRGKIILVLMLRELFAHRMDQSLVIQNRCTKNIDIKGL